ncbi:hypothetical protein [Streptomyces malaysiensis]
MSLLPEGRVGQAPAASTSGGIQSAVAAAPKGALLSLHGLITSVTRGSGRDLTTTVTLSDHTGSVDVLIPISVYSPEKRASGHRLRVGTTLAVVGPLEEGRVLAARIRIEEPGVTR